VVVPGLLVLGAVAAIGGCHRHSPKQTTGRPITPPKLWERLRDRPDFFPIAVWYQSLLRRKQCRKIGVNIFVVPNGEVSVHDLADFERDGVYLMPARNCGFPLARLIHWARPEGLAGVA
jgi:hypothetical protein